VIGETSRKSLKVALLLLTLQALAQAQSRPAPRPVTRNPHGNIAIPCENCHTFTSWKPIRSLPEFDHNKTSYPLRGMHEKVGCVQCHTKLVFTDVSTNCAACHADIHRRQFGANCEQCHTVQGWNVTVQAIRNHQNRFPLLGAHAAADCDSCHKGAATGQFQGLSTQCYSCHTQDFRSATNPNHVAASFPTTCEQCHGMNTWLDAKFDHSLTGFPLTGAHVSVPCSSCHLNGQFAGAPTDCVGCHVKDFQGTSNPNHLAGGFSTACQTCHTTTAWQPATFDHSTTGFPLTGAHVNVACTSCHVNNNYNLSGMACSTCHMTDYQNTNSPGHSAAGFPTDCTLCHSTASWTGATFNHAATGFPLTGAHLSVACSSCHVNNNYSLTNTACVSCHLNDFQGTINPSHVAAGFPQQCELCHTTTAWQPSSFNHSNTAFPLTGAHVTVACASCHVNNNYTTVPTDCYSCHKTDYQSTTNPNHAAAGFPTTCQTCHTTTAWTGATFNHTWFPTNHGNAQGVCATCHTNSSDYSIFQCTVCHTSAATDQRHTGVRGYVYNSINCYQCHPSGNGG
jgi:hypothetical protein